MYKPHFVHILQNPFQGSAFIAQHLAGGYRHGIMAKGGYDTASFTLQLAMDKAEIAFADYIGTIVQVYVDNPMEPVWEGYIERITWRKGGVSITRSLENMTNRVTVTYYNNTSAAANKTEQTVTVNNLGSQALYGIKEGSLDGGVHYAADITHKEAVRSLHLAAYAYPQVSVVAAQGGDGVLEFECKGLQYMAWDWSQYKLVSAVSQAASSAFGNASINTAADAPPNAAAIYATDPAYAAAIAYRDRVTNTGFQMPRGSQGGQTHLQFLQSVIEGGDGGSRWVFGVTTIDPNTGLRYVVYRPADPTIRYTAYAVSDTGRVRNVYGQVIDPWLVLPDVGIRINDILIGWDEAGDDPRIGYIESVTYEADSGMVQWQTGDDVTLEGAIQRKKPIKRYQANAPFSAVPRQTL